MRYVYQASIWAALAALVPSVMSGQIVPLEPGSHELSAFEPAATDKDVVAIYVSSPTEQCGRNGLPCAYRYCNESQFQY